MIHQVNLYKDEFRPQKLLLSFRQLSYGVGAILSLSLLTTAWTTSTHQSAAERLATATAREEYLVSRIAELAEKLEQREQDSALSRRIELKQRELERGARVVALLREERLEKRSSRRFSDVMEAFARQSKTGVWLSEIAINDEGFRFDGFVDNPSRMPSYLEGLGQESVFVGQGFSGLNITHRQNGAPMSFSLRSETIPGDDAIDGVAMEAPGP